MIKTAGPLAWHVAVLCKVDLNTHPVPGHVGVVGPGSMQAYLQGALISRVTVTNWQRLCCDGTREGTRPWGGGWNTGNEGQEEATPCVPAFCRTSAASLDPSTLSLLSRGRGASN